MRALIASGPRRRMDDQLLLDPVQHVRPQIEGRTDLAIGAHAVEIGAFDTVDEGAIRDGPAERRGVVAFGFRDRIAGRVRDDAANRLWAQTLRDHYPQIFVAAIDVAREHQTAHIFQTRPSGSSSHGRSDTTAVRPLKVKRSPCAGIAISVRRTSIVI
jgi:hypothetical protein